MTVSVNQDTLEMELVVKVSQVNRVQNVRFMWSCTSRLVR